MAARISFPMELIDGNKAAAAIIAELQAEVSALPGRKPCLALVRVGEDPASVSYVKKKEKTAAEIGVTSRIILPPVTITALAGVGQMEFGAGVKKPPQAASFVSAGFELYLSLAGLIDINAEVKRLEKQLAEKRKHMQGTQAKLANENFVARAPAAVIDGERKKLADWTEQVAKLDERREALGC